MRVVLFVYRRNTFSGTKISIASGNNGFMNSTEKNDKDNKDPGKKNKADQDNRKDKDNKETKPSDHPDKVKTPIPPQDMDPSVPPGNGKKGEHGRSADAE